MDGEGAIMRLPVWKYLVRDYSKASILVVCTPLALENLGSEICPSKGCVISLPVKYGVLYHPCYAVCNIITRVIRCVTLSPI